MLHITYESKDIHDREGLFCITQYYGEDCQERLKGEHAEDCLYKEVKTDDGDGIVIGFEDNEVMDDLYYIIYVPEKHRTVYALALAGLSFINDNEQDIRIT